MSVLFLGLVPCIEETINSLCIVENSALSSKTSGMEQSTGCMACTLYTDISHNTERIPCSLDGTSK